MLNNYLQFLFHVSDETYQITANKIDFQNHIKSKVTVYV